MCYKTGPSRLFELATNPRTSTTLRCAPPRCYRTACCCADLPAYSLHRCSGHTTHSGLLKTEAACRSQASCYTDAIAPQRRVSTDGAYAYVYPLGEKW